MTLTKPARNWFFGMQQSDENPAATMLCDLVDVVKAGLETFDASFHPFVVGSLGSASGFGGILFRDPELQTASYCPRR